MPRPRVLDNSRDQEVARANRELAAYFKGQRTEREARAALKIIKAFIRDRQHTPPDKRRPLPGMKASAAEPPAAKAKPKPKKMRRRVRKVEPTEGTGVPTEQQSNEDL